MAQKRQTYHHKNLRNALIETGIQLVSTEGVNAFSLRKVAAACGVSHAAPYSHFQNKEELLEAMDHNFEGYDAIFRMVHDKTPKYGNDDDYADSIMQDVFNLYHDLITGRPTMRGGKYGVDMLPTTCHVYFGEVIGATANGRKANIPVSEGISPEKSADVNGPTAVIKSCAKMDHLATAGTLLNQKFTPDLVPRE